jgi:hypothetical protein
VTRRVSGASAAREGTIADHKPQRPVGAVGDADSRRHLDIKGGLGPRAANVEASSGEVRAILPSCDSQSQREFAGTRRQVDFTFDGWTAAAHGGYAGQRFQRADEDAAGLSARFGNKVQAFVHSVYEIHVGVAGFAE